MVNYNNGKIYKIEPIVDHDEGDIYIGSTTKKYLSMRMDSHRSEYKRWENDKCGKIMVFDLFDKYGVENCQILLLEKYNCESKEELHAKEAFHIKNNKCVNKYIPGRTRKEHYEDNKEKLLENRKKYHEENKEHDKELCKKYYKDNKEKLLENSKKRGQIIINCPCGCIYKSLNVKARHERTKKHIENMAKLE